MCDFLGIDTSNYTTSCAVFRADTGEIYQAKQLLPVKEGSAGLRQSDAVFHHTRQLPEVFHRLLDAPPFAQSPLEFSGIGVTTRPRGQDGSYMPCFLCGKTAAELLGTVTKAPVYETSHQVNHVLAALYSAKQLSLCRTPFLAFHVSGGTTDCLLCEPDAAACLKITQISTSLDLKAGQLIDRVGLLLGLPFPCGAALESLSLESQERYRLHPTMKAGDCCLSGWENRCQDMVKKGVPAADVARYCLTAVRETILQMTAYARETAGNLPVLYAGGVMSNQWMRQRLAQQENVFFAEPAFSADNAAGAAIYAAMQAEKGTVWQF